jgi:translation elongation factor EF-1alpha
VSNFLLFFIEIKKSDTSKHIGYTPLSIYLDSEAKTFFVSTAAFWIGDAMFLRDDRTAWIKGGTLHSVLSPHVKVLISNPKNPVRMSILAWTTYIFLINWCVL